MINKISKSVFVILSGQNFDILGAAKPKLNIASNHGYDQDGG